MPFEERIDTHTHLLPPFYQQACRENGHTKPDGMPRLPDWTPESHLSLMDKLNISKSILSISTPGTYLTDGDHEAARKLSRQCNEYTSGLSRQHPTRFGFWASLPLPDVEGSLTEIHYALDTLHANGVTVETNHHGVYLGDSRLNPIFDELNRRCATVFIHPTTPCLRLQSNNTNSETSTPATTALSNHYPNPIFEFLFDTARAVINLFTSGTISRCPNITFIIPHAGGALPPLIERFTGFGPLIGADQSLTSTVVKEAFARQFYFDLAGFPFPDQIFGLLRYVGTERLLYGSDYPFTPEVLVVQLAEEMEKGMVDEVKWDEEVRRVVLKGNAVRLLS
ncbi:hypothetical protein BGW36DRAFT_137676 [Talaromyces proteolyticus]|uniref:6-methylsalicylate decarboxylase n=1 Tax=Talaromyces proteolyticus TaxID=1131652 RepID=A0AAD4KZU0_9EURO|nr:uncharacterized protein BGW36DRAFT_137676 [Talaromyces proteolyticus]KAH8700875.1 hypothetical protein BGW36DRAFT_137676 [Talaromyces proteolyticus]